MPSIFLAVGHGVQTNGVWDSGCVDGSEQEANLMFSIAGAAKVVLRNHGVIVHTDHDTKNDRNMTYTVRDANSARVDSYVSLHCDYNKSPSGTLPIIYPGSSAGMHLANAINASVTLRMGLGTRGVLQRADYEVSETRMPSVIFETGSIRADIGKLKDFNKYGQAIAFGIMDYLGVGYAKAQAPIPSDQPIVIDKVPKAYTWNTKEIQYFLNICNYGAPKIDGIWGPETEACLRFAQNSYRIAVDGLWGHVTEGAASGQITVYQRKLVSNNIKVDVDGIPGPKTYEAVKEFQRSKKLTADGIVGPRTYPLLMA